MTEFRFALVVLGLVTTCAWTQERTLIGETENYRLYSNHDIESKAVQEEQISGDEYRRQKGAVQSTSESGRGLEERALPGEWEGFGGVPFGCNGPVYDIERGPDGKIYFGGDFVACNDVVVNNVGRWNPATNEFEALGSPPGRSSAVFDLEFLPNGDLIESGSNTVPHVWDGVEWEGLGDVLFNIGPNRALAVDPSTGDIYLGGPFTSAFLPGGGTLSLPGVARWDGAEWVALGDGLNGRVLALEWRDGILYAGGEFTASGPTSLSRVAAWDGSTWTDIGGGVDSSVNALAHDGVNLFVGGRFNFAGGVDTQSVAVWDGSSWSSINGPTCCVEDLFFDDGQLYVAGGFSVVDGQFTGRIAIWDGAQWSSTANSAASDRRVIAVFADSEGIFVGGDFSVYGTFSVGEFPSSGIMASRIVRFDSVLQQWQSMGSADGNNLNGTVRDMVALNDEIWIAGDFRFAGTQPAMGGIARWGGQAWLPVPGNAVPCGTFQNLAVSRTGVLYADTGCSNPRAVRLDGDAWVPLLPNLDNPAFAIAADPARDDVYLGGIFTAANGEPPVALSRVARWDDAGWNSVGIGPENGVSSSTSQAVSVSSLSAFDGQLMLAGSFDRAGTVEANGLALWSGDDWAVPGLGLTRFGGPPFIFGLITHSEMFYAAGLFDSSGDQMLRNVARFNGQQWTPLEGRIGQGLNSQAWALHAAGDNLFVGGFFTEAGGRPANAIAMWDGDDWRSLGSGIGNGLSRDQPSSPFVRSIVEKDGVVYVAGEFAGSGTELSPNLIRFLPEDFIHRDRFEQQ